MPVPACLCPAQQLLACPRLRKRVLAYLSALLRSPHLLHTSPRPLQAVAEEHGLEIQFEAAAPSGALGGKQSLATSEDIARAANLRGS
jgi:hypothetical protein